MTRETPSTRRRLVMLRNLLLATAAVLALATVPSFCMQQNPPDAVALLDALLKKDKPLSDQERADLKKALENKNLDFEKVKERITSLMGKSEDAALAAAKSDKKEEKDLQEKYEAQADSLQDLLEKLVSQAVANDAEIAAKEKAKKQAIADWQAKLPELRKAVEKAKAKLAELDKPNSPLRVELAKANDAATEAARAAALKREVVRTKKEALNTKLAEAEKAAPAEAKAFKDAQTDANKANTDADNADQEAEQTNDAADQRAADNARAAAAKAAEKADTARKAYEAKVPPALTKDRDTAQTELNTAKTELKALEKKFDNKTADVTAMQNKIDAEKGLCQDAFTGADTDCKNAEKAIVDAGGTVPTATAAATPGPVKVTVTNSESVGFVRFYNVPNVGSFDLQPKDSRELTLTLPGDTLQYYSYTDASGIAFTPVITPTPGMTIHFTQVNGKWTDDATTAAATAAASPGPVKVTVTNSESVGFVRFYNVPNVGSFDLQPKDSRELTLTLPGDTLQYYSYTDASGIAFAPVITPTPGQTIRFTRVNNKWTHAVVPPGGAMRIRSRIPLLAPLLVTFLYTAQDGGAAPTSTRRRGLPNRMLRGTRPRRKRRQRSRAKPRPMTRTRTRSSSARQSRSRRLRVLRRSPTVRLSSSSTPRSSRTRRRSWPRPWTSSTWTPTQRRRGSTPALGRPTFAASPTRPARASTDVRKPPATWRLAVTSPRSSTRPRPTPTRTDSTLCT